MDFASLMSKEISKSTKAANDGSEKYLKRSEIEAEREAKYQAEQRAIEEERQAKFKAKRKREEEDAEANKVRQEKRRLLAEESKRKRELQDAEEDRARRKRLGLPELVAPEADEVDEDDIVEEDLREKLRQLGQPAKLFGESHRQRLNRYKKSSIVMTDGPIPTSLVLVEEKDMKVETVPTDADGRAFLYRQLASYFTMVLREWETALSKEQRDTFASKQAYNAMVQSKENMTPVSIMLHASPTCVNALVSSSASLKRAMLKRACWNPLLRLSRPRRKDAMSMPTMATCA